jgi:hypothetical protein
MVSWSPDSSAYAYLAVGDPPKMVFISSVVDSLKWAPVLTASDACFYEISWLDSHRVLLIAERSVSRDRYDLLAYVFSCPTRTLRSFAVEMSGSIREFRERSVRGCE